MTIGESTSLLDRESLLRELRQPRRLTLTKETWEAAAALAGLRVAANDAIRAPDRDRGDSKNMLAEITGSIGELAALRRVNQVTSGKVTHHPIDFGAPVDAPDLTVTTSRGAVAFETKAHLDAAGKRWLMVNQRARERSERRGVVGYVPVLGALGGSFLWVGRLITIPELHGWQAPDKGLKDPAVGLELGELAVRYFDTCWQQLRGELRQRDAVSKAHLRAMFAEARRSLRLWKQTLPELESLRAVELVDVVQKQLKAGR